MSDLHYRVVKLLKDNGFVGDDGALRPVEIDNASGSILYAKKSWFGFGGYHLTNDFQDAKPTKCVKTLVVPWGNSLPKLEDKNWVQLPSLHSDAKWSVPITSRPNKYTSLTEEVMCIGLVTVNVLETSNKEVILYALRASVDVIVSGSKGISDLIAVLKLFGVDMKPPKKHSNKVSTVDTDRDTNRGATRYPGVRGRSDRY
jgi:hypothetical protein